MAIIPHKQVFPVAITLGFRKPTNLDFIIDSILDSKTVITDGLLYNNQLLYLDIPDINCDAPAKSFIKQPLQFNGKHGYYRCDQIGVRVILDNEKMSVLNILH